MMSFSRFKSHPVVQEFMKSLRSALRVQIVFVPCLISVVLILLVDPWPLLRDRYFDLQEVSRPAGRVVSVQSIGRAFGEYTVVETDQGFFAVGGLVTVAKGEELTLEQHQKSFRLCAASAKHCVRLHGSQFIARLKPAAASGPTR